MYEPAQREQTERSDNSETLEQCFWALAAAAESNKAMIWANRIKNITEIFSLSLALWGILLKA